MIVNSNSDAAVVLSRGSVAFATIDAFRVLCCKSASRTIKLNCILGSLLLLWMYRYTRALNNTKLI